MRTETSFGSFDGRGVEPTIWPSNDCTFTPESPMMICQQIMLKIGKNIHKCQQRKNTKRERERETGMLKEEG